MSFDNIKWQTLFVKLQNLDNFFFSKKKKNSVVEKLKEIMEDIENSIMTYKAEQRAK